MEVEAASKISIKPEGDASGNFTSTNVSTAIEAVIATASHKLTWTSALLRESSDVQQCLLLNQLMQSTMDTLEKAFRYRNMQ